MELARFISLYQLDDILEGCRPVEALLKGFADQRAGRCVVPTSGNLCEELATLFLVYAPDLDTIGATPVEIPFYQCVSLSQMCDLINGCTVMGKGVVLQVSPNLHDPCIRTDLSFRILRAAVLAP
jgi:hypothetical protein